MKKNLSRRDKVLLGLKRQLDNVTWTLDIGSGNGLSKYMLEEFYKRHNNTEPCIFYDFDIRPIYNKISKRKINKVKYLDNFNTADIEIDAWGIIHPKGEERDINTSMTNPFADLNESEIIEYPSPSIKKINISKIIEKVKQKDVVTSAYGGSIYEWSYWLRGMENLFIDIASNSKYAEIIINKVAKHTENLSRRWVESGIDIICFYDDIGMQDRLQINPEYWRKMVKPRYKRIIGNLKEINPEVLVFYHSDGKVTDVIEDFIEIGIDILNPLQPESMPLEYVKKNFGNDLSFWGTISNQKTLPFGNRRDIFNEVSDRIETFGPSGLVISPSNILGRDIPWDNIDAFCDACINLIKK